MTDPGTEADYIVVGGGSAGRRPRPGDLSGRQPEGVAWADLAMADSGLMSGEG